MGAIAQEPAKLENNSRQITKKTGGRMQDHPMFPVAGNDLDNNNPLLVMNGPFLRRQRCTQASTLSVSLSGRSTFGTRP